MTDQKNQDKEINGNILLMGTMLITLVLPLALILLSYVEIISGTADYLVAFAVISSAIYIVGGGIWMGLQDKIDGKNLKNG